MNSISAKMLMLMLTIGFIQTMPGRQALAHRAHNHPAYIELFCDEEHRCQTESLEVNQKFANAFVRLFRKLLPKKSEVNSEQLRAEFLLLSRSVYDLEKDSRYLAEALRRKHPVQSEIRETMNRTRRSLDRTRRSLDRTLTVIELPQRILRNIPIQQDITFLKFDLYRDGFRYAGSRSFNLGLLEEHLSQDRWERKHAESLQLSRRFLDVADKLQEARAIVLELIEET